MAPGKTWDKITEGHEPHNLLGISAVTSQGMALVNSHRVHEMPAARGQVNGSAFDGGLDHYTVAIDVQAALDRLDLGAFLEVYDPLPLLQDAEDEYVIVRASGAPCARI